MGYGKSDTLLINSGELSGNIKVKDDTVIFTVGKGKISVKGAADKYIHLQDADGDDYWFPRQPPTPINVNKNGKAITLTSGFIDDSIDVKTSTEISAYANTVVTIDASAVEQGIAITANKKANKIIGSEENDYIDGGLGKDTIYGGEGNDTLYGGKGNDVLYGGNGADIFVYGAGDGNDIIKDYSNEDTIKLTSGTITSAVISGSDYIFTISKGKTTGKITVKGATDKYVHFVDANGNDTWYPEVPPAPINVNKNGKAITLTSGFIDDSIDINTNTAISTFANTIVTIDASEVVHDVVITANKNANKIIGSEENDYIDGGAGKDTILGGDGDDTLIGGKGNDSLKGGDGADIFLYNNGDGNDIITDYTEDDMIKIDSGTISNVKLSGSDVVFKIGKGSLTVKNGKNKSLSLIDSSDNSISTIIGSTSSTTLNITDSTSSAVTLNSGIEIADASTRTKAIKITGNAKDNSIVGGHGNNTIIGGFGNDTLVGGNGYDVFVYNNGDGNDLIKDWDEAYTLRIDSGSLSAKVRVEDRTVIFTVGNGKISLEGAAGKRVAIEYDDEVNVRIYTSAWFLAENDDFADTSDDLSSLVKSKSLDYSAMQTDNFNPKSDSLPTYTYSGKKK